MKTKAVRLYGENDLRMEEFELSPLKENEVRMKIISDSLCMSSYKAAIQGGRHKRVPINCKEHPIIIGHECCGIITEIGDKWKDKYNVGQAVAMQPAHFYKGTIEAPGYSYTECGGDATYINVRMEIMEMDCLLPYNSDVFFYGSLAEPMSCIIGGFHAMYHTEPTCYEHKMGIVDGGKMAMLASVGPMGLGAIDYALHGPKHPSLLVITDIDNARLERAESIYSPEHAKTLGIELVYLNTTEIENPVEKLKEISGGMGYDDVFVFAPVRPVAEQGNAILGKDGCMNFFAGPTNPEFSALFNLYDIHYSGTHILGTTGGNTDDMREAIKLMNEGIINPTAMITHVGGLNAVADATCNLPNIPGGKKLIYNQILLPLTAIADFRKAGNNNPLFRGLADITELNNGLWCAEAEKYLLANTSSIE